MLREQLDAAQAERVASRRGRAVARGERVHRLVADGGAGGAQRHLRGKERDTQSEEIRYRR